MNVQHGSRASTRVDARSVVRIAACIAAAAMAGCAQPPLPPPSPQDALIARGRALFFNETFGGNGRTCGTCHPADNNFTIDPAFIARLPPTDPLFVAEFVPALQRNFENPRLMREFGLILENLDGFADLENRFVMRGVPHVLAMRNSVASPQGPRTGWSGDGAPGDGSLRAFATGAVIQHFTKTLDRVPGVDFRLPTADELDALEAFQLSLGRQEDLSLPLALKGTLAPRGQAIFMDNQIGKCNICHGNAGANATLGAGPANNANFDTGVAALPDHPARLTGERMPVDDGLGSPGNGTFNTPPLVEAADTGPFFHDNAVATLEGAIAFYNGAAFNNSPSGQFLRSIDPNGRGIALDATQIEAVATFLRVLNVLEAVRESTRLLDDALLARPPRGLTRRELLQAAQVRSEAAVRVIGQVAHGGSTIAAADVRLREARRLVARAARSHFHVDAKVREAREALVRARAELVSTP